MSPANKPDAENAYIFGRFHINVERLAFAMDGYQTMGFVIACSDGRQYTVRFVIEDRVQVIAVDPARCGLTEVVFTDGDGVIKARRPMIGRPPGGFVLTAGTAYYLGDFFAQAGMKVDWMLLYKERTFAWQMMAVEDNYEATSDRMQRTFTNLARLPTENRMMLPRKHIAGAEKEPTGWVRGGRENIVLPLRAARLAGFTGQRYATPAACEAVCPGNGDCIPFRGDGGPAVTCVVRCKADVDCPLGLACNCPTGDGSRCHAIASTPEDAMAGICLSVDPAAAQR
ncbi:MAG TPA: hypothetical protein VIF57_29905 [Polyangia bacterium]